LAIERHVGLGLGAAEHQEALVLGRPLPFRLGGLVEGEVVGPDGAGGAFGEGLGRGVGRGRRDDRDGRDLDGAALVDALIAEVAAGDGQEAGQLTRHDTRRGEQDGLEGGEGVIGHGMVLSAWGVG
jgi:hypothetical protein